MIENQTNMSKTNKNIVPYVILNIVLFFFILYTTKSISVYIIGGAGYAAEHHRFYEFLPYVIYISIHLILASIFFIKRKKVHGVASIILALCCFVFYYTLDYA